VEIPDRRPRCVVSRSLIKSVNANMSPFPVAAAALPLLWRVNRRSPVKAVRWWSLLCHNNDVKEEQR